MNYFPTFFCFLGFTGFVQAQVGQVEGFPPYTPAPALLEVLEDSGDTLLVRHALGETEVPKNPKRLYTDASTTQIALSLGVQPVGVQYFSNVLEIPGMAERLAKIEVLGTNTYDPNFEAIVSVNPDLIVVWANVISAENPQARYAQLSQIAPTLVLGEPDTLGASPFSYWQEATVALADVLGLKSKADALRADYNTKAAIYCEQIREVVGAGTLTLFNVSGGALRVWGPGYGDDERFVPAAFGVWAYRDCNITPGEEVSLLTDGGTRPFGAVSLESLGELQADYFIAYVNVSDPNARTYFDTLQKNPVWQLVPAVAAGNVYELGYLDASSYYAALHVLEQAAEALSK